MCISMPAPRGSWELLIRANEPTRGKTEEMSHDPKHLGEEPLQLRSAARCGAKTRSGRSCQAPAVAGRARCRMHGGAKGSGGPRGRRNGNYKHGRYTAEAKQRRLQLTQWIRNQLRETRALMKRLDDLTAASRKSN